MPKQLNISLGFSADTSKAKKEIQDLVETLNKLSSNTQTHNNLPITKEIIEAQNAAKQLGNALQSAFNSDTGKLDLTSFNRSLHNSGMSLKDYSLKLTALGIEGDQAFLKIAQSIVNTQAPLRKSNALLQEFATTLKNTARWQLSSSILHGFAGAVQQAYGYAKDLDKSLNDIRIVSGRSADEMVKFAESANKAAQALHSTTTAYTNASLIYYQQGLSEEEIQKRTEITIKMANVARQDAQTVSDQMTAVWNNFYDGTKSLEYYADVMTALGAKTASSTDEIAGGLEKFAAIGDTIGLSYEYAASALATITSNTRQSEEVVGTALKTIFARIQGLNLGETLDDGTTLNKYSEALDKVGISIFNQAGGLKTMDALLDELGSKWDGLNSAQQTALAQTVAGVRQYTQLIALMENWNNGDNDSFQANLLTAQTSTGALQEQANIYAEGWEASRNRVKASLESIYDSLIDEEFFIELNDALAVGLNGVDSFIDSIGGAKGVVLLFGTVLTKVFKTDIASGINNAIQNFRIFAKITDEETSKIKKQARDLAISITKDMDSLEMSAMRESVERTYQAQKTLASQAKSLSPEQIATAEEALQVAQSYNEQAIAAGKAADAANKLRDSQFTANRTAFGGGAAKQSEDLMNIALQSSSNDLLSVSREIITIADNVDVSTEQANQALREYAALLRNGATGEELSQASNNLFRSLENLQEPIKTSTNEFDVFQNQVDESARTVVEAATKFETLKQSLVDENISGSSSELVEQIEKIVGQANSAKLNVVDLTEAIDRFKKETAGAEVGSKQWNNALTNLTSAIASKTISTNDMNAAIVKTATGTENLSAKLLSEANSARNAANSNITFENAVEKADEASEKCSATLARNTLAYQSLGSALTGTLGSLTSFAMAINSIQSIFDTIKNEELSSFEKTTQVIMSLGMAIPMLVSGFGNLGKAIQFATSNQEKGLAVQLAHLFNTKAEVAQGGYLILSKNGEEIARRRTAKAAKEYADKVEGATVATIYDTKATLANVKAKMLQYWWIGAIALIAVGAVVAIKEIAEAYNAETEAAQKAAEAAATLKESYENARQAADEFKSTISNYDDAINSLQKLTKGTVEYQEALLKANDAAYDLINKYDDLTYTVNADGLITIDQESLQKAQQEQLKSLEILQAQTQQAQAYAKQASVRADTTEFLRKNIKTKENAFLEEDNGYGAAIGATAGGAALGIGTAIISGVKLGGAIGSMAGPIGTAIGTVAGAAFGAIVGNTIGSLTENSATDRERDAIDKLAAAYRIEGEGIFADGRLEAILDDEKLSEALRANEQETRNLVAEMAAANRLAEEANRLEYEKTYGKYYEDFEDEDVKQMAITYGSNKRQKLIDEFSFYFEDSKGLSFTDSQVQKAYAEIMKDAGVTKVNNLNDNKAEIVYANGDLQTVDDSFIRRKVAEVFVDTIIQSQGELPSEFYGIPTSEVSWGNSLYLLKDEIKNAETEIVELSKTFVDNIQSIPISSNIINFENSLRDSGALSIDFLREYDNSETAIDDIIKLYGQELEPLAQAAGMTVEEYVRSLVNGFITTLDGQKDFAKEQLTQTTEDIFNNLVNSASGIQTDQLDEIANQIQDAFIHGGEDKAQEIADLYADLGENADEFNGVLSTIDWNTIDLYSFKNLLIDNGIELDNVDDATLEYIIALEKLTASLEESADTAYAKLAKLSKLNYGDIISDEEYKDLSDNVKSTLVRAPGGGWMVFDEEKYKLYTSGESVDEYRQNVGSYQEGSYAALRGLVNGFYDNESLKEVVNIISSFGQEYLSNKDWQLFQGLAAEINSGKELKGVDLTNFTRIAETLWDNEKFNYQNIQQQIEEQENLVDEAIIDSLLIKYDLVREDIKNYKNPFEGIAQARFDRGIGDAVSFYESGDNANDLSMDEFENVQQAIADVLNINTSSVTREFINRLQSSGILKNIVSNQNFDNNIIQARDDLLKVISEEIASTFSDEETTQLKELNKNSSKESVEKVLSSLTNVQDKGLETIISYFDLLGWEIGVGDDGKLYVKAQKSDASIFGSQILKEDDKKADKIDNVRLSETVERYKEITDSLNDLEDAYSDVSKQADRLYGADRLKKLQEQNKLLKQRQVLLEQEKKEAEAWLVIDRQALSTAFQDAGFELRIDKDTGNILNYTEVLTELNKKLNEQIDIRNKITDKDSAETHEKNQIEPIKKQIEAIRELAGAYDETQRVIVDSQNKIDDAFNEWQDNNYQQLTYKIEIKFDIDDMEMREIERRIRDLGDEFTNMAEIASLLSTDKLSEIMDDRDVYNQENLEALTQKYNNKEISQEDYVAQLKEMYNGIYDNIDALYDLDETMKHYYGDTLQKGAARLAEQTAGFDKLNSALDHYKNLITLVNGEYDYDSIGSILEGKADNLKNNLDVATSNYQMLLSERARIQQLVDNAQTEEARKRHEIELKAIEEQVDEAHAVMLDKTAEWAEAQKALMENIMDKAARDMEKAFTNGMGFDALNNSIQRVSSNSDEYLTKTNQIYETQKLMNTAQQAIDKTTNSAAKARLKNYQDEIKALQDKNKLTNIEIDLAKARYDVLLAEIALEEAQNAKSTVRLQRDNEGNFGYVYTADQAKVAEAEQNLLDTQNNLYNIRLDAANDYGQKIMDLNQQLADDLMALEKARTEGQYATEAEYQAAKDQILREYYDLYTTYSNIYALASAEDARIEQEAWVSAYNDIINNAENWQYYTGLYTQQCENAYSTYRATVAAESEIINQLLNGVQQSVFDITTESDKLATYIKDTLIPEIEKEYKKVTEVTTAYNNQLTAISDLKKGYDELAGSILGAMTQFNTFNGLDTTPPPPPSNTDPETDDYVEALAEKIKSEYDKNKPIDPPPTGDDPEVEVIQEVETAVEKLKKLAVEREILGSLPYYARFNTGGYTGEWGPAGRLAMLDEKELVLNKDDTENFLVATGILRSIVDLIDINSLHNQVSNLSSAGFAPLGGERLEQSVSIEAHFPSVSDRNEIEEAFNNLINTASQYANRKV